MNGISPYKERLLEAHRIRWEPGLNDPTMLGWATVTGYLAVALLAWRAGTAAASAGRPVERWFWRLTAALMLFLAVNKQLDFHVLVTDIGRYWAVQNGWYQYRRSFQTAFIAGAVLAALAAAMAGTRLARGREPALRLAVGGLALAGLYILIRAASFHHADVLLRTEVLEMRWSSALELAGIAMVGLAAWRYRPRKS